MQGNRTNHFSNKTSFKKGNRRTPESIEKQRQTMINNYRLGLRTPPKIEWTNIKKQQMVNSIRKTKLIKFPIGSKRLHDTGDGTYYVVKVSDRGRWLFEHRVVMEKFLDRKLKKSEIVHHIDRNKLNNKIANLRVMTNSEHTIFHHTKSF